LYAAQPGATLLFLLPTGKVDELGHLTPAAPVEDVALKLLIGNLDLACPSNFRHDAQIVWEKVKHLV
jgi:hypothetical protein